MKKSNKEIRDYATHYIKKLGSVSEFKKQLSEAIHDLSSEEGAVDNVNQLYFFVRVLFYLRYEIAPTQ